MGLVADDGQQFYAEFTDYDRSQCDEWILQNVIRHTRWLNRELPSKPVVEQQQNCLMVYGNSQYIVRQLRNWLSRYPSINVWADCYAWDWVLFCELFGGALQIPENIFYMPGDLVTLFMLNGLDADTDREAFAELDQNLPPRHNSLTDALLTQACFHKLKAKSTATTALVK